MNDTASELKKIEEAEAALAEQREEIERKEREYRYKREQAKREAEYRKQVEAEEAMFDAFRQAVGDDLWARAETGGADCSIIRRQVGRYIGRHATKYEPRLRIERCYTGVGHHQNHRPRDYKISDDFKKPIEYLKEIADAHAANVQSMDEDEKYIADTGLEGAYGVHVRRKTRRGRLSVGYEFVLWELPEDEMKQVVDLLNSFKDE
jgi:hypothetical protein